MNEPARVELPGELGLPEKNPLPSENGRRAIGRRFRKTLDGKNTAAEVRLDRTRRPVRGPVVEEIHVDPLIDQVVDDVLDDVSFVVRGDDRHDGEIRRHCRAFYGSSAPDPVNSPSR